VPHAKASSAGTSKSKRQKRKALGMGHLDPEVIRRLMIVPGYGESFSH
jgi:hypothetical protein